MATNQPANQPGNWIDPARNYNFRLEIQGVEQGHFTECHGLGAQVKPIRYREGGLNQVVHAIPGQLTLLEVTLRWGFITSTEMWEWFLKVMEGNIERRNVTIVILNAPGTEPVVKWNLIDSWPTSFRGTPLNALGNEVAMEDMSLVYERLTRA
jgi:phage tail-like protein